LRAEQFEQASGGVETRPYDPETLKRICPECPEPPPWGLLEYQVRQCNEPYPWALPPSWAARTSYERRILRYTAPIVANLIKIADETPRRLEQIARVQLELGLADFSVFHAAALTRIMKLDRWVRARILAGDYLVTPRPEELATPTTRGPLPVIAPKVVQGPVPFGRGTPSTLARSYTGNDFDAGERKRRRIPKMIRKRFPLRERIDRLVVLAKSDNESVALKAIEALNELERASGPIDEVAPMFIISGTDVPAVDTEMPKPETPKPEPETPQAPNPPASDPPAA
jgi:hypothetical protein